jgi:hypothetical protein
MISRSEQRRLYKAINVVLWTDWDPIGCGVPEDEYDSYVPRILGMLIGKVDKHRLAQHLHTLETVDMGLSGNMERNMRIAERLLELFGNHNGYRCRRVHLV